MTRNNRAAHNASDFPAFDGTRSTAFRPRDIETYIPSCCKQNMRRLDSTVSATTTSTHHRADFTQPRYEKVVTQALKKPTGDPVSVRPEGFVRDSLLHTERPPQPIRKFDHPEAFTPPPNCGLSGRSSQRYQRCPELIGQEDKAVAARITASKLGIRHRNEERIKSTYGQEEVEFQRREAERINGLRRQKEAYMRMVNENEAQANGR
ncbi:hypothetical protein GMRT_11506 [Giardia muris]|uniref:Uncharacterized protein n=1 Tax=Giardia muris TaxID=5742 RepID=A0A4Z1TBA1_GIAMU|nr:hypothetical protein GMRT_11506 [Giardia muris]|eukprot:TNJ29809.1 hypothetical protein GMRT_11506 [Giardia muris]